MSQGHQRFPWRVTAIIVVLVAVASLAVLLLLGRERLGTDQPAPATPSPTASTSSGGGSGLAAGRQLTVLLTVRDDQREAVSTVLIGIDPTTGAVSELLLPRDLLLPTNPPTRLSRTEDPTGTGVGTAEGPLETLLGVQIDALVDLDRLAWSGLIDGTGSRVDPIAARQPGSFGLVLDRVLAGLPYEPQRVGELLTGLGSMARLNVPNEDASALLALVGRGIRKADITRAALPVTFLRAGAARTAVADHDATDALMRELFPEALLRPGHEGAVRVLLQPAGATVGAVAWARMQLADAGMGVVTVGSSESVEDRTTILIPAGSPEAEQAGRAVADALDLPASALRAVDDETAAVDVRVLLGADASLPPRS